MKEQLQKMVKDVDDFQRRVLELPIRLDLLPTHRLVFRADHMREEINEFVEAHTNGDYAAALDGLVDLVYIAIGAMLEMGVLPEDAFGIVHEANMKKLRGETKRGEAYDAVKPEGWEPPNYDALIEALRLRAVVTPTLLEATRVVQQRAAAYNGGTVKREDHFPLGAASLFQMIWVKVIRMRSDIESNRAPNRDHLIDLINYADFMVCLLDGRPM